MVTIRPDKELGTEGQPWPTSDPNTDSRQAVHVISVLVCLSSVLLSRMENLSASESSKNAPSSIHQTDT
ncbi:hypothetical protein FJT64_024715 [Amphibalanus amphitrite]|uniref:Uncharacterized protein n=1 Tax=Amphibalanus amphitrite TaxID=1232801 RepID=A0A6A4WMY4_AMPAM|nr:hypothetical protein FJT64_024715 [Amphibalanus amphitrite]